MSEFEGMARVLAEHMLRQDTLRCRCGHEEVWIGVEGNFEDVVAPVWDSHESHQAQMLTAAGYGSMHEAWEQAMDAVAEQGTIQVPDNPYKETP